MDNTKTQLQVLGTEYVFAKEYIIASLAEFRILGVRRNKTISMNYEEFKDKSISLIVWNTEKEDDVHIYLGDLHFENAQYYFINKGKGWRVSLNEEQLNGLRPVSDDLKETLLGADYALSMSMAKLPENNTKDFEATGMKWHD